MAARPTLLPGNTRPPDRSTDRTLSDVRVDPLFGGFAFISGLVLFVGGAGAALYAPYLGAAFLLLGLMAVEGRLQARPVNALLMLALSFLLFVPLMGLGPLTLHLYAILIGGLLAVVGIMRVV